MPLFLYGGSLVLQPEENFKYLTINSNLRQFFWLHTKTGTSKVGDVVTPTGRCMNSEQLYRGFSWTCFAGFSWGILHT